MPRTRRRTRTPGPSLRRLCVASRRPSRRIATRSATFWISPRMWEVISSVWVPASPRISSRISMIWRGSRPLVGSSRTSTSGSFRRAWAIAARWRKPLESFPIGRRTTPPRARRSITELTAVGTALPGNPFSRARTMRELMTNDPARERRGGHAAPALALLGGRETPLLPVLRRVLHRLPRVGVVRGEVVGVLPGLHLADEVVRAQDPLGTVGERHVRQEVFLHVFLVIDVVARENDGPRLREPNDQHLASRGVPHPALHDDAIIGEEINIALELEHLPLRIVRHHRARGRPEEHEVAGDVAAGGAGLGPEGVPDLVLLHDQRRVRELRDVAAVVQVHVTDDDVLDVVRLEPDLAELDVDGDVRRAYRVQRLDEVAPVARVSEDPVVVTRVEDHVAPRVPDDEESDGDLNLRRWTAGLEEVLGDGEGA